MPEQQEEDVDVKQNDHDSEKVQEAFGIKEPQEDSRQNITEGLKEKNQSGEGGLQRDTQKDQAEELDPDTPIADLGSGETSEGETTETSPQEPSEDSDSAAESGSTSEGTGEDLDLDEEIVEHIRENPDQAKDVLKGHIDLTQRAQAISDLERLDQLRQFVQGDPARREKFIDFVQDLTEGKFDADTEVEVEEIDVPENVKGTEYEDLFRSMSQQQKQLAEKLNQQSKFIKQMNQQQTQQDFSQPDVGQRNEEGSMDAQSAQQDSVQEYEQFVDNHPELLDESGNPTDRLETVAEKVKQAGGGLSWEEAYHAVNGTSNGAQNSSAEESEESVTSQTAPSTSELVDSDEDEAPEDTSDNPRFEAFQNPNSSRDKIREAIRELS